MLINDKNASLIHNGEKKNYAKLLNSSFATLLSGNEVFFARTDFYLTSSKSSLKSKYLFFKLFVCLKYFIIKSELNDHLCQLL